MGSDAQTLVAETPDGRGGNTGRAGRARRPGTVLPGHPPPVARPGRPTAHPLVRTRDDDRGPGQPTTLEAVQQVLGTDPVVVTHVPPIDSQAVVAGLTEQAAKARNPTAGFCAPTIFLRFSPNRFPIHELVGG